MQPNDDKLKQLIRELRKSPDVSVRFQATASLASEITEHFVAMSEYANSSALLRIGLHVRSDVGYECLNVVQFAGTSPDETLEITSSAWRLLKSHGRAVAIDTAIGSATVLRTNTQIEVDTPVLELSDESLLSLTARDATHLLCLPLANTDGRTMGMISIDYNCQRAMDLDFIWMEALDELELIASVSAPWLCDSNATDDVSSASQDSPFPIGSAAANKLTNLAALFSRQRETILLAGPTGVGKSQLAQWIHSNSPFSSGRLVSFTLLGVNEDLQLAQLFGTVRGAFPGAIDRPGLIAEADKGTLFIDEVDKLSMEAQAGLLHLLETGQYRRIGDVRERDASQTRLLIATNANLLDAIERGEFRQDLYFRINVLPIRLPPLAERSTEIPEWSRFMLNRINLQASDASSCTFHPDAIEKLCESEWPGNLRQLDNVIRRAYALTRGVAPNHPAVIGSEQISSALEFEASPTNSQSTNDSAQPLLDLLDQTAEGWANYLQRHRGDVEAQDLLKVNIILALVWKKLETKYPEDKHLVAELMGKQDALKQRNYQKERKREFTKIDRLFEWLGVESPSRLP